MGTMMFQGKIPGYTEKEIVRGDDKFTIQVPVVVKKRKTWDIKVNCTREGCVEVPFKIDGPKQDAIAEACRRYRHTFELSGSVMVTCTVTEIHAAVGATA